jgi:hypothetical protein
MSVFSHICVVLLLAGTGLAQTPVAAAPGPAPAAVSSIDLGMLLAKIEQDTQTLNAEVGRLRIDKWKTDSGTKQQETDNAASIQRNITAALPDLIAAVRNQPQSLAANFKLYRNLSALHDVLAGLGESTGAFGKKEEYESLAPEITSLDQSRRNYGDYLEQLATNGDARLAAAARQAAAVQAAQPPPKKIIVDDTETAPKPAAKKRAKKKPSTSSTTTSEPAKPQ